MNHSKMAKKPQKVCKISELLKISERKERDNNKNKMYEDGVKQYKIWMKGTDTDKLKKWNMKKLT